MTNILRRSALWASAIITTGFGLALVFAPAALGEFYGTLTSEATITLSRLFGAISLAFTVLALGALRIDDLTARRAIDATFLSGYVFIGLATLWNVWQYGTAGADVVTWSTVALYAVMAVAFGYFLFGEDMRTTVGRARPVG
jgi:hypothetical protein